MLVIIRVCAFFGRQRKGKEMRGKEKQNKIKHKCIAMQDAQTNWHEQCTHLSPVAAKRGVQKMRGQTMIIGGGGVNIGGGSMGSGVE